MQYRVQPPIAAADAEARREGRPATNARDVGSDIEVLLRSIELVLRLCDERAGDCPEQSALPPGAALRKLAADIEDLYSIAARLALVGTGLTSRARAGIVNGPAAAASGSGSTGTTAGRIDPAEATLRGLESVDRALSLVLERGAADLQILREKILRLDTMTDTSCIVENLLQRMRQPPTSSSRRDTGAP